MNVRELLAIDDRVAVVTGGAGKYGRAIVEGLVEAGARVALGSRNTDALSAFRDELAERGFDRVSVHRLDQGDDESRRGFVEEVYETYGTIDILVNNAVARPMKGFGADIDAFDESMRVNATGLFALTRLFGDRMAQPGAQRGAGSIINIASIQGVVGVDPTLYHGLGMTGSIPDYFFHKAGLINLTRFLAAHYGDRGVRVNAVSPGGMYAGQPSQFVKRYAERTMLGRMAEGDDIKGIIVFLASDASKYITGENIMVDGGYVQK